MRLVLASQSPARLTVLRNAGVIPIVQVSYVDEDALTHENLEATPAEICLLLARAKAEAVAPQFVGQDVMVLGCDSVFDVDGIAYGKPGSAEQAKARWNVMMGRSGILRTGHWLIDPNSGRAQGDVADTTVHMGTISDAEMDAYLATGEPFQVAGGFTLDALGGAFVDGVEGDPSNVVGLSLPTLRRLLADFGITWTDLWEPRR
ncbi:MAG: septum formation inhibitor Maf [Actinobacteria bacterium]|nr:septum formation inhibitor Maf [Actinomycetota bacterium]